ncbi:hypothetical protein NQ318_004404 [Aromia moschata]|uniref:UV radiation resistance-associated gene protein n=1 Tax=Aromia moschata TaxID=1265417 RepID=A0AAV8YRC7_9CUCU|nr:hypothetical protein NQ318_004404 [Aromia moschata]
MNFSTSEFVLSRQRCRQWVPLITQQLRLRHVYQIIGFNLLSETAGSYYFTLHLTTMCAPFYTSEQINNPNPKWIELDLKNTANTSASCIVLRIWQHCEDGPDKIVLTWGVNFSGLVYIGNKIAEIQPKPVPFLSNLNLVDTLNDKVIYRRIAIKSPNGEVQSSYNLDKLRRLHSLQVEIKKKTIEVENIREKINSNNGLGGNRERESSPRSAGPSSPTSNVRYAPQLLTMNSLNRMLQEKPTKVQKQEMVKISKEIEIARFKTRLLSQEKDKKTVTIRQLKQRHCAIFEENEERSSVLMENYHHLSRESEKLKEYKRSLMQHREVYSLINSQLQQRRRRLLQELLFIYPIQRVSENKYTVHGIYLPNSDILADCSDTGLSIALGYVTHMLVMCSTFLQVPLRYPLTHYGSRSFITDNVSPLLPDRERDFPLYTRGKDKAQFTYAVYLLNKNLAQLRWLCYMNTSDLRATLSNLSGFLQGQRDLRHEPPLPKPPPNHEKGTDRGAASNPVANEKYVSLHSLGSNPNVSDPILDCIRQEKQSQRSSSPTGRPGKRAVSKPCRDSECGRGLGEILAIPEAFLNKQISSDSFRSYMASEKYGVGNGSCCDDNVTSSSSMGSSPGNLIKITNGRAADVYNARLTYQNSESIEQGTDPLAASVVSRSMKVHSDSQLRRLSRDEGFHARQSRRISRSVGSYTDDDCSLVLRTSFELGSEPLLNVSCESQGRSNGSGPTAFAKTLEDGQQEFLEKWLESTPDLICSTENLYPDEFLGATSGVVAENSPLTARTDALLKTKSFNLVKQKP